MTWHERRCQMALTPKTRIAIAPKAEILAVGDFVLDLSRRRGGSANSLI
jgi:hypothetical protein